MTKLKLGPLPDGKPVKLTVELPAQVHRDLMAYAEVLAAESGQAIDPARLIAPMLARFISMDQAFAKARRSIVPKSQYSPRSRLRNCRSAGLSLRPCQQAMDRTGSVRCGPDSFR